MAWQDELRVASFRGVPFMVETHDTEFGRRTVTHEYPNSEDPPFVEDMGAAADIFLVDAFVIGEDYTDDRDELMEALAEPGDGELVHPYLGTLSVSVTDRVRMRESTAEGGMARFSITFTRTRQAEQPDGEEATEELALQECDSAQLAIEAEFSVTFSIEGPGFVMEAATGLVGQVLDRIQSLTNILPAQVGALGDLLPNLASARSGIASLVNAPATLASTITGLVGDLVELPAGGAGNTGATSLKLARELFAFGADLPAVPLTTPSRLRQAANQRALTGLVRGAATVAGARVSAGMSFASFNDAVKVRDELADQIDQLAESSTQDQSHFALVDMRAAVVRDISARGANLARTVSMTTQQSLPSLVLAYNLYEDATREDEVTARNNSRHPGFMTAGRPLEVLVDA
jgi:prophage DNA circulation protein